MGEPPLFLAASIFFAIKDAISAARAESGLSGPFRLDSPASAERIRNACADQFTKLVQDLIQQIFAGRSSGALTEEEKFYRGFNLKHENKRNLTI